MSERPLRLDRDEYWTRDGRTAHVPVLVGNTVEVAYEALAQLMLDAGFVRTNGSAPAPVRPGVRPAGDGGAS